MSTLRVNETKITAEKAFSPDHLWMEAKHESKKWGSSLLLGTFCRFMSGSFF